MGELIINAKITHENTDGFYTDCHIEAKNLNPEKFNKIMINVINNVLSDYADGDKMKFLIGLLDFEMQFKKLVDGTF